MDGYAGNKGKAVALTQLLNQGENHCKEQTDKEDGVVSAVKKIGQGKDEDLCFVAEVAGHL